MIGWSRGKGGRIRTMAALCLWCTLAVAWVRGDEDEERHAPDGARDDVPLGGRLACAVVVGGEGGWDLREDLGCVLV